jgi:alkylhydroperoxidase/carboxymuconolactone decarboxylase family protein
MPRPFYTTADLDAFAEMKDFAPDAFEGYAAWSAAAFSEGALCRKTKELVALAVAHAIQCPYCIDLHAKGASSAGATREEMVEAIHVASVIRGGAALVHGVQALKALDED